MAKDFVINTDSVNSYGTRILTSGIDTAQFERNPVLLYMHRRDAWEGGPMVIGRVENLRTEGDRLLGTPVFDVEDEFASKIARKWDNDFLRMCSAGVEPIEFSSAPEHVSQGQTRATVTKCKLVEVSIVDIGSNDDALKLYEPSGKVLTLAAGVDSVLLPLLKAQPAGGVPPVEPTDNNQKTTLQMEKILLMLGLAATATEADALAAITRLQDGAKRSETLELARIETAVDGAITAGKTTADKRDKFIALGKAAGYEHLSTALDALSTPVKPIQLINTAGGGAPAGVKTDLVYGKMSEKELVTLRKENPTEFDRLFTEHFGFAPGSMSPSME